MDVVVVGAGVIGASVAWRLGQAGAKVTILEKYRPGSGSSGLSFAWPNSQNKHPRAYHDLNVAGIDAHAALLEEWKGARWSHPDGHLEWYLDEARQAQQKTRIDRLKGLGYPAEWIDGKMLRRMEPDLDPGIPDDHPVAWFEKEGWIDPVVYVGSMVRAALDKGARILTDEVMDLAVSGRRVTGVQTGRHGLIACDAVVNCAGGDANEIVREKALHIPIKSTPGLTVITPPLPLDVTHLIHNDRLALRPDGAGRLLLHSLALDDEIDPATAQPRPDLPAAVKLVDCLRDCFPSLENVAPEAVRLGWRPVPGDTLPVVGPVPGVAGYYLVVTHSGVTLAPLLGRLVARELMGGEADAMLDPFRAARFFD